eukprot:jgi/Botrbrau1/18423/Bobra.0072s0015.1
MSQPGASASSTALIWEPVLQCALCGPREVKQQLEMGHLVLLTGLGFSMCGEKVLCSTYDVALNAAADLRADRVVLLMGPAGTRSLSPMLPWHIGLEAANALLQQESLQAPSSSLPASAGAVGSNGTWQGRAEDVLQGRRALEVAVAACSKGVPCCHLVPAHTPGALLSGLLSSASIGTVVASGFAPSQSA